MKRIAVFWVGLFFLLVSFSACEKPVEKVPENPGSSEVTPSFPANLIGKIDIGYYSEPFRKDVKVGDFFCFVDSLVLQFDSLTAYPLSEHILVNANPRIIDSLEAFEYERMMARDSFVYEQRDLIVLHAGDSMLIPSDTLFSLIKTRLDSNVIDVNIPEFRLRIVNRGDTFFSFPVRVGRYERKYLALAGNTVDLRTARGVGKMIRLERDPVFINPCDGKRFYLTHRDDGRLTTMPLIPWMEPEIGGTRPGHLIHPTTNPKTLGKAYSNGCVGTGEAAAWRIYYNAPIGTKVVYRYDLESVTRDGDTLRFKDIYGLKGK